MSPFRIFEAKRFASWQIEAIGNNMLRDEDKRELISLSGKTPGETLVDSVFANRGRSWIAYAEDTRRPVAIFGYERSPNIPGVIIWMVATYQLYAYSKAFLKISSQILDNWLEKFGTLHNYIDIRNKVHIDWLISLGFELPAGMTCNMKDGVPFQYFIKEK